ncbi:MAG: hypothetical protein QXQ91_03495 [Nanopusillaceae archaeon]
MSENREQKLEEVKSKLRRIRAFSMVVTSITAEKFETLYNKYSHIFDYGNEKYEIRITGYRSVSESEKFDDLLTQFKKYVSEKERLICMTYMGTECDPDIMTLYYFVEIMKINDNKKPVMKLSVPVVRIPMYLVSNNELEELGIERHFTDSNYIIVYNYPEILWINQHVF